MQQEIAAADPSLDVRIHGVNKIGYESGNAGMCEGRTIPLCQDQQAQDVWTAWKVAYRDVVILDPENRPVAVFNLTTHGLGTPANYDSLKSLILQIAGR